MWDSRTGKSKSIEGLRMQTEKMCGLMWLSLNVGMKERITEYPDARGGSSEVVEFQYDSENRLRADPPGGMHGLMHARDDMLRGCSLHSPAEL